MSHTHPVYDTDPHFIIDPLTRSIISESGKKILMQNDHNSERFTFEIPRFIEEHDMILCNVVEVHYINKNKQNTRLESANVYPVVDLDLLADDNQTLNFSWLISQNATVYPGDLEFLIRFACVNEEAEVTYQWSTDIHNVIEIEQGMFNTEVVVSQYPDALYVWREEFYNSASSIIKEANDILEEVSRKATGASFELNMLTGELEYESTDFTFTVNEKTGNLEWEVI